MHALHDQRFHRGEFTGLRHIAYFLSTTIVLVVALGALAAFC